MHWNVVYLEHVENWLMDLEKDQFKSVSKEVKLLELSGNQLRLPHSKTLGSGLFELRERKYGLRIYYTFSGNELIVLMQAGDKSTQERDIAKARNLLKKYKGTK
jgi:putative addiction module killer protein